MNKYILVAYDGYIEHDGELYKIVVEKVSSSSDKEIEKHIKDFKKRYSQLEIKLKELIKGKWQERIIQISGGEQ
ncbi:MAG: hypothetical protein ACRC4T_08120 [Cetobacterium sp.]